MTRSLFVLAAALIAAPLAAQATPPTEHVGNFNIYQQNDPIDDTDRSRAVVVSERGATFVPAILGWECRGPHDVVLYMRNVPYGPGDRRVGITWRFDRDEPQSSNWSLDDHGFAYFEGDDDTFADFITDFRNAQSLAVRATSVGGEQATFIFNLAGSSRALNRIACMVQDSAEPPAKP
jgi:hypothetical protein